MTALRPDESRRALHALSVAVTAALSELRDERNGHQRKVVAAVNSLENGAKTYNEIVETAREREGMGPVAERLEAFSNG